MIYCSFSQYSSRYDDYLSGNVHSIFSKEEWGGALYDMNVYNLHLIINIFGVPEKYLIFPTKVLME
jgi:predicted dehydrogenase